MPLADKTEVTSKILEMIDKAQDNIKMVNGYYLNIEEVEDAIKEAITKRGVKVEIVTARIRDQAIYQSFLNSDLFSDLQKLGVKVYEEPYKVLHWKALSVDDGKFLTIGSMNQDHCAYY